MDSCCRGCRCGMPAADSEQVLLQLKLQLVSIPTTLGGQQHADSGLGTGTQACYADVCPC
jgi:hypothetical protein